MKLLLGTAKGLVVYVKKTNGWRIETVHFKGFPVSMIYVDAATKTWWAGVPHRHWGQKLHRSTDGGKTWQTVQTPRFPSNMPLKNGKNPSVKLIWCMASAADRPNELWLGTEPGGLFHSEDNGDTWRLNTTLWQQRLDSDLWFGAGKDEPFIHSIVVNPQNSDHVFVAISCAGVYETIDNGKTWQPRNKGLKATYLPNPNAELGHDPHLLLINKNDPSVLWQQNHCGVFRSTDFGKNWDDITDKNGIANYGFALAIDPENPLRAWTIPAESDENRIPHNLALCVCRTDDGGETWQYLRKGLPQKHCFDIVFRHSFDILEQNLAFGSVTGNLYLSENAGDSWKKLSNNLARIDSVWFLDEKY